MAAPPTPLTPWRRLRRRHRARVVWMLAGLAGIGTAMAGTEATAAVAVVDVALAGVSGALVVWFAGKGRRWPLPLLAAPGLAIGTPAAMVCSAAALALSVIALRTEQRDRVVNALIAALAVQGLYRLDGDGLAHGVPTAAALAPALLVVLVAVASMSAGTRRHVLIATGVAGVVVGLLGAAAVFAATQARRDVTRALDESRDAVALLRTEDRDQAVDAFARAADAFEAAHTESTAPWAQAARLLPVAAQNLDAVERLSRAGTELAQTSAAELAAIDLDALELVDGRIDLALVKTLHASTTTIVDATRGALADVDAVDSPWLAAELDRRRDDLRAELVDNLDTAETTEAALAAAPWLLGADAPRSYLVLFTTPAEARELGGFVGAYGVLTADGGRLSFESGGSIGNQYRELADVTAELPDIPLTFAYRVQEPETYPQAWTGTADFPTVAAVATTTLDALGQDHDGTLLVDPYAIAALGDYAGPVDVPELNRQVQPDDLLDFLLRDQYLAFEEADLAQGVRKESLGVVAEDVFDRLVDGALPRPTRLLDDLGPLVDGRRLLFTVDDPAADAVLADAGLTGALAPSEEPGVETVALAVTNVRGNKLDAYVSRQVTFAPSVTTGGELTGTIEVSTTNATPPASELTDYVVGGNDTFNPNTLPEGVWWGFVAVYTTLDVTEITIDGEPTTLAVEDAFGMRRYAALTLVRRGQTVDVGFHVVDTVDPERFRVDYVPFAAAIPDEVTIDAP